MINERNFFDLPVKNNQRIYDNIWNFASDPGDDFTTSLLKKQKKQF